MALIAAPVAIPNWTSSNCGAAGKPELSCSAPAVSSYRMMSARTVVADAPTRTTVAAINRKNLLIANHLPSPHADSVDLAGARGRNIRAEDFVATGTPRVRLVWSSACRPDVPAVAREVPLAQAGSL